MTGGIAVLLRRGIGTADPQICYSYVRIRIEHGNLVALARHHGLQGFLSSDLGLPYLSSLASALYTTPHHTRHPRAQKCDPFRKPSCSSKSFQAMSDVKVATDIGYLT